MRESNLASEVDEIARSCVDERERIRRAVEAREEAEAAQQRVHTELTLLASTVDGLAEAAATTRLKYVHLHVHVHVHVHVYGCPHMVHTCTRAPSTASIVSARTMQRTLNVCMCA